MLTFGYTIYTLYSIINCLFTFPIRMPTVFYYLTVFHPGTGPFHMAAVKGQEPGVFGGLGNSIEVIELYEGTIRV